MLKLFVLALCFASTSVFAQNMADTEKYDEAYIDMPDGSSRYVGKCSTHEQYEKFYFISKKVVQKYFEPRDHTKAEMKKVLAKFDKDLIKLVLKTFEMYDLGEEKTELDIFMNYVDDISAETITHIIYPDLDLIKVSLGVGGGNGGYAVINRTRKGTKVSHKLMSYTFDGDMNFCDKQVWLVNKEEVR